VEIVFERSERVEEIKRGRIKEIIINLNIKKKGILNIIIKK